ncbi:MAG: hypothetical protein AAGE43_00490 [Pseudomonadota bacterium]
MTRFRDSLPHTLSCALVMIAGSATVQASELRVNAPVVDVEPITAPAELVEHCDNKPGTEKLSALLAWDLGLNCRTERVESSEVTGYRVFYRWDDRVYSQVMASAPGATIPLKISIK